MTINEWMLLLLACLAGAVSPGPSLALLIRSVIIDGRTAGVIFSIAHGAGILMYACLVVTGLETILLNSPRTLFILQVAGCGFLLWIAFKSIFSNRINTLKRDNPKCPVNTPQPILRHAREGFLIVFFNPKIAAFFFAIFSQFLTQHQDTATKVGIISIAWIVDTTWYLFVALVATLPTFTVFIESYKEKIELFIGHILVLICFGLMWRIF